MPMLGSSDLLPISGGDFKLTGASPLSVGLIGGALGAVGLGNLEVGRGILLLPDWSEGDVGVV